MIEQNIVTGLDTEYRSVGYTDWFNQIDADVAAECKCQRCYHQGLTFIGLQKNIPGGGRSYIAIAECPACNHQEEF